MNKITDIFGYISSKQMSLEYMEKILLQALDQKQDAYKVPDTDIVVYIGIPDDYILNEYKKGAVQDLLICNRNIGYIMKNDEVIVIAGYVTVNWCILIGRIKAYTSHTESIKFCVAYVIQEQNVYQNHNLIYKT